MDTIKGIACRECGLTIPTADQCGLKMWQWLMWVGEIRWLIAPTINYCDKDGNVTSTEEGYALCGDHNN